MLERCRPGLCLALAGALLVSASPALGDDHEQTVGDAVGALPGVARVGFAGPLAPGTAVSAFAGYGFTGEVLGTDDRHHRAVGELAVTLRLIEWLGFGVRLDGRYDKHVDVPSPTDPENRRVNDDGWVGDPRVLVRAARRAGDFGFGGQLNLWLPGAEAPSLIPEATSAEALALASWAPAGSPLTVSGNAGFRLDQSAESVENAMSLSLADRMALGASDANAVLVGVGATYRAGALELLGEWTWDLLVGDEAPDASESPMRVTGGVRYGLTDTLAAQLMVDVNVASTPTITQDTALVPVEPRLRAVAGLHYRFATGEEKAEREKLLGDETPPDKPEPEPEPATLAGRVVSGDQGISGATVKVELEGEAQPIEVTTGEGGSFEVPELAAGAASVSAGAEGYQGESESVTLREGATAQVEIVLEPELPPGQLRGVVRSMKGKVLQATLKVQPIGVEAETDEDGAFEIDLPPGEYEVVVEARGHDEQHRQVKIEQDGVTIINVDMKPKR